MRCLVIATFSVLTLLGCGPTNEDGQHRADPKADAKVDKTVLLGKHTEVRRDEAYPGFDARVVRPAFTDRHPKVLFDEAHFNFHTTDGGYKSFVELITNDGYRVTANKEKFQNKTLESFNLLVIVGALTAEGRNSSRPAFTWEECDAVQDWVRAGGSLLLIADHAPFGTTAEILANRFGVDMSKGYTEDNLNYEKSGHPGWLVFTRENKLLVDHPIANGRNDGESLERVTTFMGQSLKGPQGSTAFLKVADGAVDLQMPDRERVSAAGRAQGLAFRYVKGRVVVLGESAVISDQMGQLRGKKPVRIGLAFQGSDNRQLALNIMHWLSGILD